MKKTMLACFALLLISIPAWAAESPHPGPRTKPPLHLAQMGGTAPAAAAPSASAIRPTGFWMEGHLGMSLRSLMTPTPSFGSGIVLGYKLNRLVVGVGLDMTYDWNKDDSDSTYTSTTQDLSPVGFFVTGAGHFLMNWHKEKQTSNHISVEDSNKSYGFDLKAGAGGRFYLGGRVGIGLELGLLMIYTKDDGVKDFGLGPYTLLTLATIW